MTIFLFKSIGLYFLIIGLSILLNKKTYKKLVKELSKDPGLLNFVFGFITLIIGILMVVAHNQWDNFPQILVSLYGWIALIKGATLLIFPNIYKKLVKKLDSDLYLSFTGFLYLALSLLVAYIVFS